ncbi:glycosyl hydrolase family 28-related protein, partial [Rothia mucilaginosa]|uniref:glycosyl hydrolase family 28-related protein n=1 Tax=Rothia mucilaginosa TaxID=43675 RepID=UPI0028E570EE
MQSQRTICAVESGADPTGTQDSTAVINDAIRRVHEAGGGTVHLPAGAYRVSAPFIELL